MFVDMAEAGVQTPDKLGKQKTNRMHYPTANDSEFIDDGNPTK